MCRQNRLAGCMMLAFGGGILVGTWIGQGFWCHFLGICLILCGVVVARRK